MSFDHRFDLVPFGPAKIARNDDAVVYFVLHGVVSLQMRLLMIMLIVTVKGPGIVASFLPEADQR